MTAMATKLCQNLNNSGETRKCFHRFSKLKAKATDQSIWTIKSNVSKPINFMTYLECSSWHNGHLWRFFWTTCYHLFKYNFESFVVVSLSPTRSLDSSISKFSVVSSKSGRKSTISITNSILFVRTSQNLNLQYTNAEFRNKR